MDKLDIIIENQTEYITQLYREIETDIIYSIVDTIREHGGTKGTQYDLETLKRMGALDNETLQQIANMSGVPLNVLKQSLNVVIGNAIDWSMLDKVYAKGLSPVNPRDIVLDTILQQANRRIAKEVGIVNSNVLQNANKEFRKTIDKAVLETSFGHTTSNEAMVQAIKDLGTKGITSATYVVNKGTDREYTRDESLEAYMRKVIRTEYIQMVANANEKVGKDMQAEHWYVTQHLGARDKGTGHENHMLWQGKVYTWKELLETCGYGQVTGLCGINCRHMFRPFWKGISVLPKLLSEAENERVYKLEQQQRYYERKIRELKRSQGALKRFPCDESDIEIKRLDKRKKGYQAKLRKLIADNNDVLRRNYARERVVE